MRVCEWKGSAARESNTWDSPHHLMTSQLTGSPSWPAGASRACSCTVAGVLILIGCVLLYQRLNILNITPIDQDKRSELYSQLCTFLLCDLKQITVLLWALVFSTIK